MRGGGEQTGNITATCLDGGGWECSAMKGEFALCVFELCGWEA